MSDRIEGEEQPPPELLKTSEVARRLGVSHSTVLSWAYRGLLDFARTPGGQLRFYRNQVEALRQSGTDESV
ncbi:helix-turn-helix domain-containing protein [Actinomadura sp. LD22]|uniref:Helix-turn-helix domain-containing protein n=1 Tax=Actinomadura physcomitrii TaxID=2650748 RepID=A0A6I4MV54_9ACTN|nr:helix-turn-helix domain-containing protein [Actinomadura physcomitrii]MWA06509.1 helix-turn-helix domain-containing protein [Actinomadura physcomitrii]